MKFFIADTFTDSLGRLTADEQKAVKTTVFDLQANPAHPSLKFHRLDHAKDPRFWSVRSSLDLRLIVHSDAEDMVLCYVGHHDEAYHWGERRKLIVHPTTGAAQLVEIRESVQEIVVPKYIEKAAAIPLKPKLFATTDDAELLAFGVPQEWIADVLEATEDSFFDIVSHLPGEASEALLQLATGGTPAASPSPVPDANPFEHPDAKRRFRIIDNVEELERALDAPWDKWTVFLHPAQRALIERRFSGPARVSGSAGTGKTIVALHRAVFLARRDPEVRVLLTTFSETLANALRAKLRRLVSGEPRLGERIEVHAIKAIAHRLYERNIGRSQVADRAELRAELQSAADGIGGTRYSLTFLMAEWEQVVDAWRLDSWEAYRDVPRLGRKTRLAEAQRQHLWSIFERARAGLSSKGLVTWAEVFQRLADVYRGRERPPFDAAVVDEAQDLSITQLRFLAAMTGGRADALFFAGDLGQRIFQQPFSWKAVGVDIRGRSSTLKINYRTSHQIRSQADRLLDLEIVDVDGNAERRDGSVSVFNGPAPEVRTFDTIANERDAVDDWLHARQDEGIAPHEIAIFVRSDAQLDRARQAAGPAGLAFKILDDHVETIGGYASICAMHLAKGLEFRAVAVMACDENVLPLQERLAAVTDESDLEEVYASERHLLYVACTRARDHLLVTGAEPASEFLDDLR